MACQTLKENVSMHQIILQTEKSKTKAPADSVPGENSLSGSQIAISLLCHHALEEQRHNFLKIYGDQCGIGESMMKKRLKGLNS